MRLHVEIQGCTPKSKYVRLHLDGVLAGALTIPDTRVYEFVALLAAGSAFLDSALCVEGESTIRPQVVAEAACEGPDWKI